MARIDPLEETEFSEELKKQFSFIEETMGFVPNSLKTMARIPGLVSAFTHLSSVILGNSILPSELRGMIALMASTGAECRYCQAHTSATAANAGVTDEKLSAIWNFESSEHFNDSERAALRFAFHSGQVPNLSEGQRRHQSQHGCLQHLWDSSPFLFLDFAFFLLSQAFCA